MLREFNQIPLFAEKRMMNCHTQFKRYKLDQKTSKLTKKVKSAESSIVDASKSSKSKIEIPSSLPKSLALLTVEDLMKCSFWKQFIQRTGKVKVILEKVHSRIAGGTLSSLSSTSNSSYTFFVPLDSKIPRIVISTKDIPSSLNSCTQSYDDYLFIAQIDSWPEYSKFPFGKIIKQLSDRGSIESESTLILMEHKVDYEDLDQTFCAGLPLLNEHNEFTLPLQEVVTRRILLNECVFTIDPLTARDLDDALSIKRLDNDLFEVGVHIADVSYFVKEGFACDDIARKRATSVYLVQKVIPMLPQLLSNKLCSLNPGEEKLTFSVIWKMDKEGNIYDTSIGRTIIRSCVKLSYEMAQCMIDEPNREWSPNEISIMDSKWNASDISRRVNDLMNIARRLLAKRIDSGALKISKTKFQFALDSNYSPQGFTCNALMESNSLVEEFMLLANVTVAEHIYKAYPELAFLRCHPPLEKKPQNFFRFNSVCNLKNINFSSSKSIADTLFNIKDETTKRVFSNFLLRSMKMALYFCAGTTEAHKFSHFALNVPLYTHFTSPIRRYPDIIVHRLLAASLNYEPLIKDTKEQLHTLAKHCNNKKYAARLASESSVKLFLSFYIRTIGHIIENAVITVLLK